MATITKTTLQDAIKAFQTLSAEDKIKAIKYVIEQKGFSKTNIEVGGGDLLR
jgi:hypothetical protein